ncbi:MAG: hypothetical protein B7Y56_04280 [Gallionellales bacterium 35-53-114]|jgi:hypothetical protein|nr:MAG: hypothetical protein B7Y56_04280 [Gallionellales bacterium 35-53-114]OYZ65311.1 MAG: hypothetical protein B7Y04_01435 [Gallionellales bacterium 24-53-125]OZB08218.1 MAG: hypothetical protein B7X61_11890 [Gallionellales bacterium 39-52-133]
MGFGLEIMMSMEFIAKIFSQILQLLAIVFFFYAAYQGVMGEGGSTSVFTGVGVLILVLIGSYFIDKLVNAY